MCFEKGVDLLLSVKYFATGISEVCGEQKQLPQSDKYLNAKTLTRIVRVSSGLCHGCMKRKSCGVSPLLDD